MAATLSSTHIDPTGMSGSKDTKSRVITYQFSEEVTNAFEAETLIGLVEGQLHPDNASFNLSDWNYSTLSEKIWQFTLTYKLRLSTGVGSGVSNRIRLVPFQWEETREIHRFNTAGDPMMPAEQNKRSWPAFTIEFTKSAYDETFYENGGKTNTDQVTIGGISVPPFCAQFGAPAITAVDDSGTVKYIHALPVTLCFRETEDPAKIAGTVIGFQKEYLNNGFRIFKNSAYVDYDDNGDTPSIPPKINLAGDAFLTPADDPVYITKAPTETMAFVGLGIPTQKPTA